MQKLRAILIILIVVAYFSMAIVIGNETGRWFRSQCDCTEDK